MKIWLHGWLRLKKKHHLKQVMRKQILSLEAAPQELVEPEKPENLNQFIKMYEGVYNNLTQRKN